MYQNNPDVCSEAARYTIGPHMPVSDFLADVITDYTEQDQPSLESALRHVRVAHWFAEADLDDLRRAIIRVMRDRGATLETGHGPMRFTWNDFAAPVRQRIVDGLRALAAHPERWMSPSIVAPDSDCDGEDPHVRDVAFTMSWMGAR